jgi:hypothetical protein
MIYFHRQIIFFLKYLQSKGIEQVLLPTPPSRISKYCSVGGISILAVLVQYCFFLEKSGSQAKLSDFRLDAFSLTA